MHISRFKYHFLALISLVFCNSSMCQDNVGLYAFGHSLIDHASHPNTNIMHWIHDIANSAGKTFTTTGQYGFLPDHDNLPPSSKWGYSGITTSWDARSQTFSESDINTVILTAGNFIQDVAPTAPHPVDINTTVVEATQNIFDWTHAQKSDLRYFIYSNWPQIELPNPYPPTVPPQAQIDDFHTTTSGSFTTWWETYHDEMMSSRPDLNIKLIPVGKIISDLHMNTTIFPTQIPFDQLYEDSDPHGLESTYFLAGMITYMALYGENIPSSYVPSSQVHSLIRNNMEAIRNFAWQALIDYKDGNGVNRVLPVEMVSFTASRKQETITLKWATSTEVNNEKFIIEESNDGNGFISVGEVQGKGTVYDQSEYAYKLIRPRYESFYYRLKQVDYNGAYSYSPIVKTKDESYSNFWSTVYPNPSISNQVEIKYSVPLNNRELKIRLIDPLGKQIAEYTPQLSNSKGTISVSFPPEKGLYYVRLESNNIVQMHKFLKL